MSIPSSFEYLELLGRALARPDLRSSLRDRLGMGAQLPPWEIKEQLIGDFLASTLATRPDAAPELHQLLIDLGWGPGTMVDRVQRLLGVAQRREAVIALIEAAFPEEPLDGSVIREAYLEDERAFRVVPEKEWTQARERAVTTSWRDVPDAELDFAFTKNSVWIWLDDGAIDFYLPAAMRYALTELGDCAFYTLLYFNKQPATEWVAENGLAKSRAIAAFLAFYAAERPGLEALKDSPEILAGWFALI